MSHPCKKCLHYTTDIIETKTGFEVEVPLCGFGLFYHMVTDKCDNYHEINMPPTKTIVTMR